MRSAQHSGTTVAPPLPTHDMAASIFLTAGLISAPQNPQAPNIALWSPATPCIFVPHQKCCSATGSTLADHGHSRCGVSTKVLSRVGIAQRCGNFHSVVEVHLHFCRRDAVVEFHNTTSTTPQALQIRGQLNWRCFLLLLPRHPFPTHA